MRRYLWLVGLFWGCAASDDGVSSPRTGVERDLGWDGQVDAHVDAQPHDQGAPDMPADTQNDIAVLDMRPVDMAIADDATPGPDQDPPDQAIDMGVPPSCVLPELAEGEAPTQWLDPPYTARIEQAGGPCERQYVLTSDQPLRDDQPANPRRFADASNGPIVRTGAPLFDGLHALALAEVEECAVDAIRDFAFGDGQPLPCPPGGCFETGRLWNYVWTRDTAYAVDLGLASVDPTRARNSLEFKLSERRTGGDLQIVQDTGTGGSYPISTDRVVWALGARALLAQLSGAELDGFADLSWEAARNTIAHDRAVVFDPSDGLYRGEQSFLDWREQSYPRWVADNLSHVGMSKSLSTNLGHLALLELAAELGERRGDAAAVEFRTWATDLRGAIERGFWDADAGLFRAFVTTTLDPSAARQFDLLGLAHAVIAGGLGDAAQAVARYPLLEKGPAVLWPQQQDTPIYHNRGQWPFVTAYWLRAARVVGNDAVIDNTLRALVRGAALNLSNMENFEMVSALPWVDDGAASGPVVNSQRQLWSVAGYLTAVHEGVFGLWPQWGGTGDGLRVAPRITPWMRSALFPTARSLVLDGYRYRGRSVTVELRLPAAVDADSSLVAETITLNEAPVEALIPADQVVDGARLVVQLRAVPRQGDARIVQQVDDYQQLFGPRPPTMLGIDATPDGLRVRFSLNEPGVALTTRILRDGQVIAEGAFDESWTDNTAQADGPSHCYTVETAFESGNTSQRADPYCWWGTNATRVRTFGAQQFTHVGGALSENHGRPHIEVWGDDGHEIRTPVFALPGGPHLIQVVYGNGAGGLTTGITCAVKRVRLIDEGGNVLGAGYLPMAHTGDWSQWRSSGFVAVDPPPGRYRVVIDGDARAVNMSSFAHFSRYTGGTGGQAGAFNRVNISEIKVLARDQPGR